MKQTSGLFKIDWADTLKGVLVASIGAILTPITESLNAGILTFDWKHILAGGITAGLAYIVKNFFTPAKVVQPLSDPNNGDDLSDPDKPRPKPGQ
jgi:hypothetical protein